MPILRHAYEGDAIWAMGNRLTLKLRSAETGGTLNMQEVRAPVGAAPPLQRHHREAMVCVLFEGCMIYRVGEETFEAGPGSTIHLPRGLPHTFRVVGTEPARFLSVALPGGLENMYEGLGRPAAGPGLPGPPTEAEKAAWLEACPRYGKEIAGPPLPDPEG